MATVTEQLGWQDQAACQGMALDVFFPPPGARTEAAQRACSRCPVVGPCGEFGERQSHGVWGGRVRSANVPKDDDAERRRELTSRFVPEALQPPPKAPYSCQPRTITTTTEASMTAKTTTTEAPAETADTRAKSAVSQDGTATCSGCKTELPVTRFPTTRAAGGGYERSLKECRPCRNARRAANRKTTAA